MNKQQHVMEKRLVGSVWCILGTDSLGKMRNGFIPIMEVPVKNTSLGAHIENLQRQIRDLTEQNQKLVQAMNERLDAIVKTVNQNQVINTSAIETLSDKFGKGKFL